MIVLTSNKIKSICQKWFNVIVTDQQVKLINEEVENYLNIIGDDVIGSSDLAEIIGDIVL